MLPWVLIIMQHKISKKNTFCLLRIIEIYSTRECQQFNYLPTIVIRSIQLYLPTVNIEDDGSNIKI